MRSNAALLGVSTVRGTQLLLQPHGAGDAWRWPSTCSSGLDRISPSPPRSLQHEWNSSLRSEPRHVEDEDQNAPERCASAGWR